ncbi:MAG: hypothetical protein D4R67_04050 [Bacteroidetes bacterium]|nr:MAG: hypothetical protein D4R67_04050 [Bacteroidota bacterium]
MEQSESPPSGYYRSSAPFYQRSWARYSFFFLVGVVAGIVLMYLAGNTKSSQFLSDEDARGTIYNSSSFDKMKPADVIYVDNPTLKTAINVRYSTQVVEARMDLSTLFPVKVMVEFSYNDFRVLNLQNLTGNDQSTTLSASNYIQIENVGDNKYIIQWLNRNSLPHQISFRFYQNDMVVYSNAITVNKE